MRVINNGNNNNDELWEKVAGMLGVVDSEFFGGPERCGILVDQLSYLLEIGYTRPEYKFNYSPSVETFLKFGKLAEEQGAKVVFLGFLYSKYRENPLIVIEGIEVTGFPDSASLIMEFSESFHDADEFTTKPGLLRAWYD